MIQGFPGPTDRPAGKIPHVGGGVRRLEPSQHEVFLDLIGAGGLILNSPTVWGRPTASRMPRSNDRTREHGNVKVLREYQARLIDDFDPGVDTLIEQPTGSGKTLMIVTMLPVLLDSFDNILIIAPQTQIEAGFVERDYHRVKFADGRVVRLSESLIRQARRGRIGSIATIRSYLALPARHALVTTHAALVRVRDLPEDCRRKLLVIDEAHHWRAALLNKLVMAWKERGGTVLMATATPYRSDRKDVVLPCMRTLRRTLAQHMGEGYAPRRLATAIVPVPNPDVQVDLGQFSGSTPPDPTYNRTLARAFGRAWRKDGRPKLIVRVPPIEGGSRLLVDEVIAAFEAMGARVLDMTGTRREDKRRVLKALESERRKAAVGNNLNISVPG